MTGTKAGPSAGEMGGLGLQFVVSILLGLWLGGLLDKRFGTHWVAIAGMFVGASLSFYNMYRTLMAAQAADDERQKAKQKVDV